MRSKSSIFVCRPRGPSLLEPWLCRIRWESEGCEEIRMSTRSLKWLAAAALLAATPLGALAQNASSLTGPNGPLVIPNGSGTITYQSSGGTETAPGGTTVFHGTGSTTTVTFAGTHTQPSPPPTAVPTIVPFR